MCVKVVPTLGTNDLTLEPSLSNIRDMLIRCLKAILEVNQSIPKIQNIMFPGKVLLRKLEHKLVKKDVPQFEGIYILDE